MEQEPSSCSWTTSDDDLTCQQVIALLVEYVTDALAPETLRAFQEHLRACEDCLAYLNTYRATIRATRTLRYDDMPTALQDRLLSFLHTRVARAMTTGKPEEHQCTLLS
jgi:anti-sigma factor RsiW